LGQNDVYRFLKKNKQTFFTAKDLAGLCGINVMTATSNLKKLEKDSYIKFKTVVIGKTNHATKLYAYIKSDTHLDAIYNEYKKLSVDERFNHLNADVRMLMIVGKELKKFNEAKAK